MASRLMRPQPPPNSSSASSSSDPAGKKKKLMLMVGIGVPKDSSGGSSSPSSPASPNPDPTTATPPSDPGVGVGHGAGTGLASPEGQGVPPDAVCFHTGDENCSACLYMEPTGNCSWLKMPVQPNDHCELFEAKGGMEPDADDLGQPAMPSSAAPAGAAT